jgi:hypothetical protein
MPPGDLLPIWYSNQLPFPRHSPNDANNPLIFYNVSRLFMIFRDLEIWRRSVRLIKTFASPGSVSTPADEFLELHSRPASIL